MMSCSQQRRVHLMNKIVSGDVRVDRPGVWRAS